jgi:hypothetical protein
MSLKENYWLPPRAQAWNLHSGSGDARGFTLFLAEINSEPGEKDGDRQDACPTIKRRRSWSSLASRRFFLI